VGVPEPSHRSHVVAQLPGTSNLGGATSMPVAEDAARGCSGAARGKPRLAPTLGVRTSWSTIRPRPEPTSSSAAGTRRWGRDRSIGGQESSRTQPRHPEYHRSPTTSGKRRRQPCRCLNLSTSMGGTRSKVEGGDRHDLEPEGTHEDTRHKIYTGSSSRSSYPTSCLK
jgi:hypothetical protein